MGAGEREFPGLGNRFSLKIKRHGGIAPAEGQVAADGGAFHAGQVAHRVEGLLVEERKSPWIFLKGFQ